VLDLYSILVLYLGILEGMCSPKRLVWRVLDGLITYLA